MKALLAPLLLAGALLPVAPAAAQEGYACPTYEAVVSPDVVRPGDSATVTVTVRGPRRSVEVGSLSVDPADPGDRVHRPVARLGPGSDEQVVTGLVPLTATRDVSALVSDSCEDASGGVLVRDGAPSGTTRVRVADPEVPVRVTEADDGRTVRLLTGERLDVRLTGGWTGPDDGPSLYRRLVEAGSGGVRAVYEAMSPAYDADGRAQPQVLSARLGDRTWTLTVQVDEPGVTPSPTPCTASPWVRTATPSPHVTSWTGLQDGSVAVPRGRLINLVLGNTGMCQDPGPLEWREVRVEGDALSWRSSATSVGQSSAWLTPVAPGTAVLTARRDAACRHTLRPDGSPACDLDPGPVRTLRVTVYEPSRCPAGEPLAVESTRSTAGRPVGVTVTTQPGVPVQLLADGAPVRTGTAGPDGLLRFTVSPVRDVVLRAQRRGDCEVRTGTPPSVRLQVDPALSLSAQRLGVRRYAFSGRVLPARPGQQVRLHRVDGGRDVLLATTALRADGTWRLERRFLGGGRLLLQARTAAGDATDGTTVRAGVSAVRPTAVF